MFDISCFFFHYFSSKFTGNNCPRLSSSSPDPYYRPRPSIPPCVIQISCRTPSPPIPIRNHTSDALHTHQSLQYPSQTLHTHLKPLTPIAGPPHPTKALTPYPTLAKSTDGGVDNGCLTEWADGWLCACVGVGEIGGRVLPSVGG